MTVNTRGLDQRLDRDEGEDKVMIHKDPWSHSSRAIPFHLQLKRIKITQFQDKVRLGLMDVTIVIDETVSRELTEHNNYYGGQKGRFQSTTEKYIAYNDVT